MAKLETVTHTLEPWFDADSKVLILGTIPSPKSREYGCYYGHPQNRFWKTVAAVFREDTPMTVQDRHRFVIKHHIALWDVLQSCEIQGAEDASISSPEVNDLSRILNKAPIQAVFTTGQKAKSLYDRFLYPVYGIPAVALPSTSPANRRWASDQSLICDYSIILQYI